MRNRYSRLLFTSEDRLCADLGVQNNRWIWRHNASTLRSRDVTDQLWWRHNAKPNKMSRRHADNWSHPSHYLVDPYHWSHLRPGVQSIFLLFVSWQSDHFWLRYSKFYIWPWKFKVKVMAKVKPAGHIWAPESNRYVCFSFRGNRTIFGWDIANSIFDLENSRSRSWPRSNPLVTFERQSSITLFAFRFVAIGPFLAEI